MRNFLFLYINGEPHEVRGEDIFLTLSNYLREEQCLVGTKIVCEEGDCGACTVLVGRSSSEKFVFLPINSCIQQMHQLDGTHIVTVEGLGPNGQINDVQKCMMDCHGAQCGFCTPGFITTLTGLFESTRKPNEKEVREALTGNLCRCTGYEPILKAAVAVDSSSMVTLNDLYPSQEIVAAITRHCQEPIFVECMGRIFASPDTLEEAVAFSEAHPGTIIVQGGTDIGVQCNKRGLCPKSILNLSRISGLTSLKEEDGQVIIGGSVLLSQLEDFFQTRVPVFSRILSWFGSPQIRAAGTLAGNVVNGSPIADTLPFLYIMEATIDLVGPKGVRRVPVNEFYCGYKDLNRKQGEIVRSIHLPLPKPEEMVELYKISKRRDMDISTFTAGIRLSLSRGKIQKVRIAYGGVGPTVQRMPQTEALLKGENFTEEVFSRAGLMARLEVAPIDDVRGSANYRCQLAENILKRFYYESERQEVLV